MPNNLRVSVFLVSCVLFIIIFILFRKGRIPLKYTLVWFIPNLLILLVAIVPSMLQFIMNLLGFQTVSNMVIGMLIFILVLISISLTVIVSGQRTKITLLIQEVSLLKKEIKSDE